MISDGNCLLVCGVSSWLLSQSFFFLSSCQSPAAPFAGCLEAFLRCLDWLFSSPTTRAVDAGASDFALAFDLCKRRPWRVGAGSVRWSRWVSDQFPGIIVLKLDARRKRCVFPKILNHKSVGRGFLLLLVSLRRKTYRTEHSEEINRAQYPGGR
jgi:hypothetical protein